jgi:hypothetical protein
MIEMDEGSVVGPYLCDLWFPLPQESAMNQKKAVPPERSNGTASRGYRHAWNHAQDTAPRYRFANHTIRFGLEKIVASG